MTPFIRSAAAIFSLLLPLTAQDAPSQHYHLEWENPYVRVVRVTYGPHEKSAQHEHPALPTVYVYIADGGPMRFFHDGKPTGNRPAVKAGQVRFARPMVETHAAENLSDETNEYLRIELKTAPVDLPPRDVRLSPEAVPAGENLLKTQYDSAYLTLDRLVCAPHQQCPVVALYGTQAAVVTLSDGIIQEGELDPQQVAHGKVQWLPSGMQTAWKNVGDQPIEQFVIALKTKPQ